MNKIIITIETDNAAFQPYPNEELVRILKEVTEKIENGYFLDNINIMDINGNEVGKIKTK